LSKFWDNSIAITSFGNHDNNADGLIIEIKITVIDPQGIMLT